MKTQEVQLTYPNGSKTQLFYSPNADPRVVALIEQNLRSGRRFRIFYGDTDRPDFEQVHGRKPDPGKDWGEEHDVTGTIGSSTGPIKVPLLIHNSRSYGGGAIMTDCIVRILIDGQEAYRHPNYHSRYEKAYIRPSELSGYAFDVWTKENGVEARFHNERSAINWLAFMRGERMAK